MTNSMLGDLVMVGLTTLPSRTKLRREREREREWCYCWLVCGLWCAGESESVESGWFMSSVISWKMYTAQMGRFS